MKRHIANLILISLAFFLASCSASQRERTIKTTLAAVNETRDAFVVFDRATQMGIVEAAPTYERGAAALKAYREKREPVVEAFAFVYRAIATAATVDDDPSLITMLTAAKRIGAAVYELKQGEYAP